MRPTKSKFSEVEPLPCNEMEFGSGNLHTESLIRWQGASQVVQWKRICLPMQEMSETWVLIPESGRSPEKEMATHSSILAWEIPWTEEPGGLQFMGSQRVRYDWVHWVFVAVIGVVSSWWDWWAYSPRKRWELSPSLPCEDTIWTWPSASQEECSHKNSAIQSSWFGTSSLQNCEEINFWCWGHFFFFLIMLVVTDETWRKSRGSWNISAQSCDQRESKAPGRTLEKLLLRNSMLTEGHLKSEADNSDLWKVCVWYNRLSVPPSTLQNSL